MWEKGFALPLTHQYMKQPAVGLAEAHGPEPSQALRAGKGHAPRKWKATDIPLTLVGRQQICRDQDRPGCDDLPGKRDRPREGCYRVSTEGQGPHAERGPRPGAYLTAK